MRRKDTLKVLVQVLHRQRAQLVEDTPHFHAIVGVRILARLTRHQAVVPKMAVRPQLLPVVMLIAKDKTHLLALPPTTAGQLRHHRCWQPSVEPQEESRHRLLPKRYAVSSRIPTRANRISSSPPRYRCDCAAQHLCLCPSCARAAHLWLEVPCCPWLLPDRSAAGLYRAPRGVPGSHLGAGSVWGSAASLLSKVFRVG